MEGEETQGSRQKKRVMVGCNGQRQEMVGLGRSKTFTARLPTWIPTSSVKNSTKAKVEIANFEQLLIPNTALPEPRTKLGGILA